jgi:oligopeptide/dipeptide ABC transporter ATP-binding protein
MSAAPLIELDAAGRSFGAVTALYPFSLAIEEGTASILAVAGESGSGKTTLASLLLGFLPPSTGALRYRGQPLGQLRGAARRAYRREIQAVFQDPFAVYNPFYRVDHALTEPLRLFGLASSRRAARAMLDAACLRVGLHPADTLGRYPHQLSGGQRQRLMVARALLLQPKLLVADEPASMIDASLRALVLGSLRTLNTDFAIPIVYITHDLATAYHVAHSIVVLYRGEVVEAGDAARVIIAPLHPYTRQLVDSIPWPDLETRWGDAPRVEGSAATANGCAFAHRCPRVMPRCRAERPALFAAAPRQAARCLLYEQAPVQDANALGPLLQTTLPKETTL